MARALEREAAPPRNGAARVDQRLARRGGAVELLRLPSALFAGLSRLRAAGYDRGWLASEEVDAPVVSVGNLSAGGTGKTPFVAYLARELLRRGWRPGVLSRGYGASPVEERKNDETRWFAERLAGVPLHQDPDRPRGARVLLEQGVDVVLLDDGFQHRRLARELDLVLVDATRPWGLPRPPDGSAPVRACLPRGLLREPPEALARAHALVLTRIDQVAARELEELAAELDRHAPGRPILRGRHLAARLVGPDGKPRALAELDGRTVDLVSALGNPESFQRTVESLGARVATHRVFRDHHRYAPGDLDGLGEGERWLVTTEKDAVKLGGSRCFVLGTEFELVEGHSVLEALLDGLRPGSARRARAAIHEGLHG